MEFLEGHTVWEHSVDMQPHLFIYIGADGVIAGLPCGIHRPGKDLFLAPEQGDLPAVRKQNAYASAVILDLGLLIGGEPGMGQQFDQLGRIRLVHPGIQQGIAMGDRHSAGVFCQIRDLCRSLGGKKAEIDRKAHRNHKQQTHSQFDSVLQFHGHVRQPFLWFIRSKKLPLAGENSSLIQPGSDRDCPAVRLG